MCIGARLKLPGKYNDRFCGADSFILETFLYSHRVVGRSDQLDREYMFRMIKKFQEIHTRDFLIIRELQAPSSPPSYLLDT